MAASAAAIPRSAASPSQSNAARAPKVRLASLTSLPDSQNRTAIYDISSRVVYLPDGRRLEAHSGLGGYMDDPRYVAAKNQGPTPPNTYRLALRENPFHGVRAIRLIPVGDGNMFGRDGILAHHYLLGATGASNGCVSFANYPEFLNAYLNGDIDRLVAALVPEGVTESRDLLTPEGGWAAVRGTLEWPAFVLFAFIFLWTPPHYWPLSMKYAEDYQRAGIPMLGAIASAKAVSVQVVLYAWATVICSLLLIPVGGAGWVYGLTALGAGAWFIWTCHRLHALAMAEQATSRTAMVVFHASITYLTVLFVAVAVDPFVGGAVL